MFFVMEMVKGRIFWDPALPELEKHERTRIYDAMNAMLAALHDVDPAAVADAPHPALLLHLLQGGVDGGAGHAGPGGQLVAGGRVVLEQSEVGARRRVIII